MRVIAAAIAVLCVLVPRAAAGQTSTGAAGAANDRDRLSVQLAGGPTLIDRGNVLSAAFAYSPAPRLELLLNVERDHLSFQLERFNGGFSAFRGGTMTFVSGEVRVALLPTDRVSPFAMAGLGRGVSRPNVNDRFPESIRNDIRVVYFGGGVRVPLRRGFSVFGDARLIIATENQDAMPVWPVRAGLVWSF